ncbi:hypothetical protein MRB53_031930 [Persea americana]|uniref:Uncharacterized protein n=1 Tax=Persea americana TaxID=3435 RepID=A0ACC2KQH7_PERAE|nr:hypothetical protein MRB53_031930 [Persea americana]
MAKTKQQNLYLASTTTGAFPISQQIGVLVAIAPIGDLSILLWYAVEPEANTISTGTLDVESLLKLMGLKL